MLAAPPSNEKRSELFSKACAKGDVETVRAFLKAGLDPDSIRDHLKATPMFDAVIGGHLSVVRELIARKAKKGRTLLDLAQEHEGDYGVELLKRELARRKNPAAAR